MADAGPVIDAGPVTDAGPIVDGPVCPAPEQMCRGSCTDVTTSATDCGSCGHVCASGICQASHCLGELPGHIIAIGHDYQHHNAAMARVLGNAAALGATHDAGIARLVGTAGAAAQIGTAAALTDAMTAIGRPWHVVAVPALGSPLVGVDVLIVDAQTGDGGAAEAAGVAWKSAIDALIAREGVVIVLEGTGGVGHRFAAGAGLFTFPAPIDATSAPAFVSDASDAVVQQVVSPYLADTTSAVYVGVVGAIATPSGAVVVHLTR